MVLQIMGVSGLTISHVKSHLQVLSISVNVHIYTYIIYIYVININIRGVCLLLYLCADVQEHEAGAYDNR